MAGIERVPNNCLWGEGKREGGSEGRGGGRGEKRGAVTSAISRCGTLILFLCILCFYHAAMHHLSGLKKIVYRDSPTRGRGLVSCEGLSAQDAPRPPPPPAGSFRDQPLQVQAGGGNPEASRQREEVTKNSTGQTVPSLPRTARREDTLFRAETCVPQPHPPRGSVTSIQGGDLCPGLGILWLL